MSADAAASAGSAESESVVSAFLEAMEQAETPFPPKNVPALRNGIQEALETYDAGLVLVGLGWWMAEGFHSPRQISVSTTLEYEADPTLENEATGLSSPSLPRLGF